MQKYIETSERVIEETPFGTMHHNLSNLTPASSEVGFLWDAYNAETMAVCYLKKWVKDSTDPEIHEFLQHALEVSSQRVLDIEKLFTSINYPIPSGYGEKDVNSNSPALFSESFFILYTRMTHKMILNHFVNACTTSYRSDFRDYYDNCLITSNQIHRRATEILLAKGIILKHPSVVPPKSLDTVLDKSYLGSYFGSLFGEERPLNATEIAHVHTMMEIKQLIRTLHLGYAQVVKSDKIRKFLLKATEIADEQLEGLSQILRDEDVPPPSMSEILITESTEPEISDRLILSHSVAVSGYIAMCYGMSLENIKRKDLSTKVLKYMVEVLGLTKDGAEIIIEAGWLESVPQIANRKMLTQ